MRVHFSNLCEPARTLGESNIFMFCVLVENSNFPNHKGKINVQRGKIGTESGGASQVGTRGRMFGMEKLASGKALPWDFAGLVQGTARTPVWLEKVSRWDDGQKQLPVLVPLQHGDYRRLLLLPPFPIIGFLF